jgi:hypothetical protein
MTTYKTPEYFKLLPGEEHDSGTYQARIRRDGSAERFKYVFSDKKPILRSGKGRTTILSHTTLKEAYEQAVEKCPLAADAILCLMWDEHLNLSAMHFLAEAYEKKLKEKINNENPSSL